MKTYKYLCVLRSPRWHEGRQHIRMAATKGRLTVLRRYSAEFTAIELPELMHRQQAVSWVRNNASEQLPEQFKHVNVETILNVVEDL